MSLSRSGLWTGVAICLVVTTSIGLLWYRAFGPGYSLELEAIRSELKKIPGIEILELKGIDDSDIPFWPQLDHISARLRISGKGELVFSDLSVESFGDAGHLYLVSAGSSRPRHRGEGFVGVYKQATGEPVRSEFGGGALDIGREGEFAQLFPFQIPNIQAAVAHYDAIVEVLGSWPQSPSPPQHFTDDRGTEFYYWVVNTGAEQDDPLWQQPLSTLRERAKNPSGGAVPPKKPK